MQRAFAEMNLHTSMVVNEGYVTPVVEFQVPPAYLDHLSAAGDLEFSTQKYFF